MFVEEIRQKIYDKIANDRTLLLRLGRLADEVLEENEILTGIYGDDIIYNSIFSMSQVLADEIEQNQ